MVWDPQKPTIGPVDPQLDPIFASSGNPGRDATRLASHRRSSVLVCGDLGGGERYGENEVWLSGFTL